MNDLATLHCDWVPACRPDWVLVTPIGPTGDDDVAAAEVVEQSLVQARVQIVYALLVAAVDALIPVYAARLGSGGSYDRRLDGPTAELVVVIPSLHLGDVSAPERVGDRAASILALVAEVATTADYGLGLVERHNRPEVFRASLILHDQIKCCRDDACAGGRLTWRRSEASMPTPQSQLSSSTPSSSPALHLHTLHEQRRVAERRTAVLASQAAALKKIGNERDGAQAIFTAKLGPVVKAMLRRIKTSSYNLPSSQQLQHDAGDPNALAADLTRGFPSQIRAPYWPPSPGQRPQTRPTQQKTQP